MPKKKPAKKPARKVIKAKPVKKPIRKAKPTAKAKTPAAKRKVIGTIRHFFPHISVAVVDLSGGIKVGDSILIEGVFPEGRVHADRAPEHKICGQGTGNRPQGEGKGK
jgi:hypothetical protein